MTQQEHEAQVAAFILTKGVTKCPTAFAVPTHASLSEAERNGIRQHDQEREAKREQRQRSRTSQPGVAA